MSIETLNLLSDSTFGDKLDEQNAILEEIRDNVGGGGSLNWIVPKIPSLASNTDDIFISSNDYNNANPLPISAYNINGKAINISGNFSLYLWIKNITFGIASNDDFYSLFTIIPQYTINNTNIGILSINQSTNYLGYTVAGINSTNLKTFKLLYG